MTNDKILDVLSSCTVDSTTRLILISAVYFDAAWKYLIDETFTDILMFHVSDNETVRASGLFYINDKQFWHGYNSALRCRAVALPYVDNAFSMIVLLPDDVNGLPTLERSLSADNVLDVLHTRRNFRMVYSTISVTLPRFNIEQSRSLSNDLTQLGMKDLFDENKADLSGIDGSADISVSFFQHRAFIHVNDRGTEAGAAAAVGIKKRISPTSINIDHPFLFFVRDNVHSTILFSGRVTNPGHVIN